jgi:hypothetical protein
LIHTRIRWVVRARARAASPTAGVFAAPAPSGASAGSAVPGLTLPANEPAEAAGAEVAKRGRD